MRRGLLLSLLVATVAFAGPHGRGHSRFGIAWLGAGVEPSPRVAPRVVYEPVYVPLAWWYWFPQPQLVQPAPVAPPEEIVVEREVVREVPAPAVAPQVIVIEQPPAPAPAPAPVAVAPAPAPEPVKPAPGPRVPGPDVFTWTDDDGVVHFSTRVPNAAKAKATRVGASK